MATEKRLIDANWILAEIEHDLGCYDIEKIKQEDGLYVELRDVVRMVCAAPTVDAVEVVRCINCQKHEPCEVRNRVWCRQMGRYMKEDGFCSEGVNEE